MTDPVFPSLPGRTWGITKAPSFGVREQKGVSGRALSVLDQSLPIWDFTIPYDYLRDPNDVRGGAGVGTGFTELRTLMGHFLACQGSFLPFLYDDPTDNIVVNEFIGTGDAATVDFQLYRTMGSFAEPITAPNIVSAVYLDAVEVFTFTVDEDTGLITFASAPGAGVLVTVSFSYYFRCKFTENTMSFENFLYQIWSGKAAFRSVLL